jgi:nucleoid-associated protein YgaU
MGLLSFIKNAGEKLLNRGKTSDAAPQGAPAKTEADAIIDYINQQNLQYKDLKVTYTNATGTVVVEGIAPDQQTKEKIILCCGNVEGVAQVDDRMTVEKAEPEAKYYTVVAGDTLSKISKTQYGDANRYMVIFEANKPMLKDPDKIYPGQTLRIPAA